MPLGMQRDFVFVCIPNGMRKLTLLSFSTEFESIRDFFEGFFTKKRGERAKSFQILKKFQAIFSNNPPKTAKNGQMFSKKQKVINI